ncbi:hypothetical protein HK096_010694, partial [Nowakowskiella sp. JEL0078]
MAQKSKKAKTELSEEAEIQSFEIPDEKVLALLDFEKKLDELSRENEIEVRKVDHACEIKKQAIYNEREKLLETVPGFWKQ